MKLPSDVLLDELINAVHKAAVQVLEESSTKGFVFTDVTLIRMTDCIKQRRLVWLRQKHPRTIKYWRDK